MPIRIAPLALRLDVDFLDERMVNESTLGRIHGRQVLGPPRPPSLVGCIESQAFDALLGTLTVILDVNQQFLADPTAKRNGQEPLERLEGLPATTDEDTGVAFELDVKNDPIALEDEAHGAIDPHRIEDIEKPVLGVIQGPVDRGDLELPGMGSIALVKDLDLDLALVTAEVI
jgi:hypothetical protein